MKNVMAFIVSYSLLTPCFLLSIEDFTLSIKDQEAVQEAEYEVKRVVCETLYKDNEFTMLLKSKLTNNLTFQHNLEPALNILAALEAKLAAGESSAPRTAKFGAKKPIWNIYFTSDLPITWPSYFALLQSTCSMIFMHLDYRSVTSLAKDKQLHCYHCKSTNHNQPHCTFASIVGWFTNAAKTDKIEETAKFVASNKPLRGSNTTDRCCGYSRGRGRGFSGRSATY